MKVGKTKDWRLGVEMLEVRSLRKRYEMGYIFVNYKFMQLCYSPFEMAGWVKVYYNFKLKTVNMHNQSLNP